VDSNIGQYVSLQNKIINLSDDPLKLDEFKFLCFRAQLAPPPNAHASSAHRPTTLTWMFWRPSIVVLRYSSPPNRAYLTSTAIVSSIYPFPLLVWLALRGCLLVNLLSGCALSPILMSLQHMRITSCWFPSTPLGTHTPCIQVVNRLVYIWLQLSYSIFHLPPTFPQLNWIYIHQDPFSFASSFALVSPNWSPTCNEIFFLPFQLTHPLGFSPLF